MLVRYLTDVNEFVAALGDEGESGLESFENLFSKLQVMKGKNNQSISQSIKTLNKSSD